MTPNIPSPISTNRVTHTPLVPNNQGDKSDDFAAPGDVQQLPVDLDKLATADMRHRSPQRSGSPPIQVALAIKTRRQAERSSAVRPRREKSVLAEAAFDAQKGVLRTDMGFYAVGAPLGKGSCGEILQAVGPTGHRVVVKVIDMEPELKTASTPTERAEVEKKYRREFSAMCKANAPCQPLDMAVAGSKLFIVLRELRVHMADEALRQTMDVTSRPHVANCAFRDIAGDLSRVHARGFLHRDLKPENFMTDAEGRVVLIDFGETLELGQKTELLTDDEDCNSALFSPETFLRWDANETFGERKDSKAAEMFTLGLCWSLMATGLDSQPFESSPEAHALWPKVHAALPVDADTGHVNVAELARRTGGARKEISLREFVLRLCRAHLKMGSYVVLHVLHPQPEKRPTADQAFAHAQLDADDLQHGRTLLKRPLACEAAKDAQATELSRRHSELLAMRASASRKPS